MLVQIPTVWNVSDIGTKPLSTKRIKVLVHELGMCENEGAYAVGQAETEEQAARHGGSKGFTLLAKNVLRVLMMLGPGPTGVFVKHIYPVCIPAPIAYIQLSETCQLSVQHAHLNQCYVEALLTQGKVSW